MNTEKPEPARESGSAPIAPREDPATSVMRVLNGDSGLAMTYWVWGVLAGVVWGAALTVALPESPYQTDSDLLRVLKFSFAGYYVLTYMAIWNAASKYTGPKVWAVLAKFVVVVTCVPIAILALKYLQNM